MTRRIWNRVPTSLPAAFEQDRDHGKRTRQMGVERMAELQAVSPSRLYKWMEEADLPVNRLACWMHGTGGRAVIRYLCAQAGGLFVPVPAGRAVSPVELAELQEAQAQAMTALCQFYSQRASHDEASAALQRALEGLAWHRSNVEKTAQPELDLGESNVST